MWGYGWGGVFCSRARVCVSERWSTSNVSVGILDFRPPTSKRRRRSHIFSPSWFELLLSVTCPRWSVRTFLCLTPSHPSPTSTSASIWTRGLISSWWRSVHMSPRGEGVSCVSTRVQVPPRHPWTLEVNHRWQPAADPSDAMATGDELRLRDGANTLASCTVWRTLASPSQPALLINNECEDTSPP